MNKRSAAWSIGLLWLLTIFPAQADSLLPYTATYLSEYDGMSVEGVRSLQQRPDGYWQIEHRASLLFFRLEERALLSIDDHAVTPHSYRHNRTGGGKRNLDLRFDWQHQTVSNQSRKYGWNSPLQKGQLDKLGYQLQIRLDLLNLGSEFGQRNYTVVDRKGPKQYTLTYKGMEPLMLGPGTIAATRLEQTRVGSSRATQLWFVPEWNYLLAKMEQRDGDDRYQMTLKGARLDGQKLTVPAAQAL